MEDDEGIGSCGELFGYVVDEEFGHGRGVCRGGVDAVRVCEGIIAGRGMEGELAWIGGGMSSRNAPRPSPRAQGRATRFALRFEGGEEGEGG